MTRLIDADRLEDDCNLYDKWDAQIVKEWLKDQPTVDAVSVVRCKDCKYSEPWYRDRRRCFLWDDGGVSVWNDGFCNYAERREK